MSLLPEFINSHSLRKPPGVCDYHAIIIDADLDLGTGLEIIPVDKRIDHRFSQSFDRVIPDPGSLHCRQRLCFFLVYPRIHTGPACIAGTIGPLHPPVRIDCHSVFCHRLVMASFVRHPSGVREPPVSPVSCAAIRISGQTGRMVSTPRLLIIRLILFE